jgi:EpsI family protein
MVARALLAASLIVSAGLYARGASSPERVPTRETLGSTPTTLRQWEGRELPLNDDVVAQLGADDYINRLYLGADAPPVALYVGYYASQRQGDAIHSPQNCLPGSGWQPVTGERTTVDLGERTIPVNRFIIQKGLDRQAVFYWYQGRSRILASELGNKAWLMVDAARLRRTDGGLVRVITPVASTAEAAFKTLTTFSTALFPYLTSRLP